MAFCVRLQFIRHRLQTYNMGPVSDISVVGLRFPHLLHLSIFGCGSRLTKRLMRNFSSSLLSVICFPSAGLSTVWCFRVASE